MNVDIEQLMGPLNELMAALGEQAELFSCNVMDMDFLTKFAVHWGILLSLVVILLVAYGICVALNKCGVRGFRTFEHRDAQAKLVSQFNFFIFLLVNFPLVFDSHVAIHHMRLFVHSRCVVAHSLAASAPSRSTLASASGG